MAPKGWNTLVRSKGSKTTRALATTSPGFGPPLPLTQPQFAEAQATPDPTKFLVRHVSDTPAYKILDKNKHLAPLPFEPPRGLPEPVMKLEEALGSNGAAVVKRILGNGQIVFHSVGDTGNTERQTAIIGGRQDGG